MYNMGPYKVMHPTMGHDSLIEHKGGCISTCKCHMQASVHPSLDYNQQCTWETLTWAQFHKAAFKSSKYCLTNVFHGQNLSGIPGT